MLNNIFVNYSVCTVCRGITQVQSLKSNRSKSTFVQAILSAQ